MFYNSFCFNTYKNKKTNIANNNISIKLKLQASYFNKIGEAKINT